MIRAVLSVALLLLAFDTPAATLYTLFSGVFAPRYADFEPPCEAGRCVNYRTDNVVTGWFTTRATLPANLAHVDIHSQVIGYELADGVSIHSSNNPDARMQSFVVSTSARGEVTVERLWLVTWTSGTRPHRPGDRLNSLTLAGGYAVAQNNDVCNGVSSTSGLGVETGIDDACPVVKPDRFSSTALTDACLLRGQSTCAAAPVSWTQQLAIAGATMPVPAMSGWGIALLSSLIGMVGGGLVSRRRRRH